MGKNSQRETLISSFIRKALDTELDKFLNSASAVWKLKNKNSCFAKWIVYETLDKEYSGLVECWIMQGNKAKRLLSHL